MHRSGIAPVTRNLLLGTVVVMLILVACGGDSPAAQTATTAAKKGLQGTIIKPPAPKPDFTLTDTEGKPFHFAAETKGQLTFLFFGYTNCPDICQIRMSQMAAMEARANVPPNRVVFVTTDPERDTASVVRKWLDHFNKSFVGLTGTPAQVAQAQEDAGVPVATKQPSSVDPNEYLMTHPSLLQAFAPDGKAYTEYPFGTKIEQYVNDARILAARR